MAKVKNQKIEISPPNFELITLRIEGNSPLMTHKFSEKMRKQMEEKQTAKDATRKKREPKDYVAEFNAARYISTKGWDGLPSAAIRAAMIGACRTVDGLTMTKAKGCFNVRADGRDVTDGTPLIKIEGKVARDTRPVRLESGVADMRNRPRYDDWACEVTIEYDADTLSAKDVANLLARAGLQVGLCELRPQAPNSFGGDFGTFSVKASAKRLKAVA
jgi:hypothetical protein